MRKRAGISGAGPSLPAKIVTAGYSAILPLLVSRRASFHRRKARAAMKLRPTNRHVLWSISTLLSVNFTPKRGSGGMTGMPKGASRAKKDKG